MNKHNKGAAAPAAGQHVPQPGHVGGGPDVADGGHAHEHHADAGGKAHAAPHEGPHYQVGHPPLAGHHHPQHADIPLHGPDAIKDNWRDLVDPAISRWHRLNEEELLHTHGRESKLVNLVQGRYVISEAAAAEQVRDFFAKHAPAPAPHHQPRYTPAPAHEHPQHGARPLEGTEAILAYWLELMGAAAENWRLLSEEELIKTEGHEVKLIALIEGRYGVATGEATRQVREFFAQQSGG